jgi:hypothetical protein
MSGRERFEDRIIGAFLTVVGLTLVVAAVGVACGGAL